PTTWCSCGTGSSGRKAPPSRSLPTPSGRRPRTSSPGLWNGNIFEPAALGFKNKRLQPTARPPDAKASGGALAAEQDFFTGGAGEKMDGKFFPRLRPRELCEAALGKALPQKNAEEKGPKRKASVLLSCWDARGCSQ